MTSHQIFQYVSGWTKLDFIIKHSYLKNVLIPRWKPSSSVHNVRGSYWSLVLGLGSMDEQDYVLDNGLMFSIYESGPWVGYKISGNPAIGWIGAGTHEMDYMVN